MFNATHDKILMKSINDKTEAAYQSFKNSQASQKNLQRNDQNYCL